MPRSPAVVEFAFFLVSFPGLDVLGEVNWAIATLAVFSMMVLSVALRRSISALSSARSWLHYTPMIDRVIIIEAKEPG